MTVPPWLRLSIVAVVGATVAQLAANWAACTFLPGPRLLEAHVAAQGRNCEGAGDKAVAGMSALLATLLGLASQPPSQ